MLTNFVPFSEINQKRKLINLVCLPQMSHYDLASSLYFRDEIRSIDFVLVWDEHEQAATNYKSVELRRVRLFNYTKKKNGRNRKYQCVESITGNNLFLQTIQY